MDALLTAMLARPLASRLSSEIALSKYQQLQKPPQWREAVPRATPDAPDAQRHSLLWLGVAVMFVIFLDQVARRLGLQFGEARR